MASTISVFVSLCAKTAMNIMVILTTVRSRFGIPQTVDYVDCISLIDNLITFQCVNRITRFQPDTASRKYGRIYEKSHKPEKPERKAVCTEGTIIHGEILHELHDVCVVGACLADRDESVYLVGPFCRT